MKGFFGGLKTKIKSSLHRSNKKKVLNSRGLTPSFCWKLLMNFCNGQWHLGEDQYWLLVYVWFDLIIHYVWFNNRPRKSQNLWDLLDCHFVNKNLTGYFQFIVNLSLRCCQTVLSTTEIVKENEVTESQKVWVWKGFCRSSRSTPLLKWIGVDQVAEVHIWAGFEFL